VYSRKEKHRQAFCWRCFFIFLEVRM
jgi:hypothetical protein